MFWHCKDCKALYAPELPACPQCGGTDYRLAPGGEPIGDALSSAPAPAGKKQRANASAAAATEQTAPSVDTALAGK